MKQLYRYFNKKLVDEVGALHGLAQRQCQIAVSIAGSSNQSLSVG
jgi:hypothetical protein